MAPSSYDLQFAQAANAAHFDDLHQPLVDPAELLQRLAHAHQLLIAQASTRVSTVAGVQRQLLQAAATTLRMATANEIDHHKRITWAA